MNPGVTYTQPAGMTGLTINGRGVFTGVGGAIPATFNVAYGAKSRYLTVSLTGQITFSDVAP